MRSKPIAAIMALAMLLTIVSAGRYDEAAAQLFGNRSVGSPLSRRERPTAGGSTTTAASDGVGAVRGDERFIRGMRSGADFVGSDSRDRRGFVGSQQAVTGETVSSAVGEGGLQIESGPDANQGQAKTAPPRTRMYDPRLRIDFRFTPRFPGNTSPRTVSRVLTRRLRACAGIRQDHPQGGARPIVVLVEGETATLRGEVAGERDRTLAGLMLSFEPGISRVQNELTLAGSPRTAAARPAMDRPQRPAAPRSGPREF